MGEERSAEWYDERYPESLSYQGLIQDSPFHGVWMAAMVEVIRMRREGGVLVDLGCGPGHLAELAPSCYKYRGYDFSRVALELAQERNGFRGVATFHYWDAATDPLPAGDIYVMTEFLEHIESDLAVLKRIPSGAPVIASLPMGDSEGHVRFFPEEQEVWGRYRSVLFIQRVESLFPLRAFTMVGTRL